MRIRLPVLKVPSRSGLKKQLRNFPNGQELPVWCSDADCIAQGGKRQNRLRRYGSRYYFFIYIFFVFSKDDIIVVHSHILITFFIFINTSEQRRNCVAPHVLLYYELVAQRQSKRHLLSCAWVRIPSGLLFFTVTRHLYRINIDSIFF